MGSLSLRVDTAQGLWWWTAIVLAILFALTLIAYLVDGRTIGGVSVWSKPLKFQASLAIHFATLALIVSAFGQSLQESGVLLSVAIVSIAATVFEITYIMVQAALQQHSHFNVSTPFHATMYTFMAIGAVVILAAAGIVGLATAFDEGALSPVLKLAIVLGLIGGTVLTLVVAFTMGSRMTYHIGVESAGARAFPITGWSRSVGDLRVAHFLATHMIQAVPLAGWLASNLVGDAVASALVWIFAAAWTAMTLATYRQALSGASFAAWSLF